MRTAITAISWLVFAAVVAWGWASQGWGLEGGLTFLAVMGGGMLVSWLVYRVAELDLGVQALEKADLAQRLHKVEWKLYEGPR